MYPDIQQIISRYQAANDFPKCVLEAIVELPYIIKLAESLYGKRDTGIEIDLIFEHHLDTAPFGNKMTISLGLAPGFELPQFGTGEVRYRIGQEFPQALTRPQPAALGGFIWRNIDKGVSMNFARIIAPDRLNTANGYGRALQLYDKFVKYAGPFGIRKLRHNLCTAGRGFAIADITRDDILKLPNMPEPIASDLTERWIHDQGNFPRMAEWTNL